MIDVGVIGASGYTGAELLRVLARHPKARITVATSRQYAGKPLSACWPGLGHLPLSFEDHEDGAAFDKADVFFAALPHEASMEVVAAILARGKKVIDLSADFRFSDPDRYAAHYGPHAHPDLLREAAYGLCEVYADRIRQSRLVANPGCYPTSALLPLVPLLRAGAIEPDGIVIDAKSGVSGAGRGATATTHFCEANESLKAYKVASHRHTPEIEDHLTLAAGREVRVVFTPHLIPMSRGMLSTIYVTPRPGVTQARVEALWREAYAASPFVRLTDPGQLPDTAHVRGTNNCHMAAREYASCNRLILLSVIDNLAKGASTQAVQNLNLLMGWEPQTGLPLEPLFP